MRISKAALLLFLICAACTSSSEMSAPAACELFAKGDAESFLGGPVSDPTSQSYGGGDGRASVSTCTYVTQDAENYRSVTLLVRSPGKGDKPEGALNRHVASMKREFGNDYVLEGIDGIGDGAVWDAALNQLTAFKDGRMLINTVSGFSAEDARTKSQELMKKLLSKLQ